MLQPILALILWTFVMFIWMYGTRIPAMQAAKINPDDYKHPGSSGTMLPSKVRAVADNYNHLHEAPLMFYALTALVQMGGFSDGLFVKLAWAYVGLRIAHSLIQATAGKVMHRFSVFVLSQLVLIVIAIRLIPQVFT